MHPSIGDGCVTGWDEGIGEENNSFYTLPAPGDDEGERVAGCVTLVGICSSKIAARAATWVEIVDS